MKKITFTIVLISISLCVVNCKKDTEIIPKSKSKFIIGDSTGIYKYENEIIEKSPKYFIGIYSNSIVIPLNLKGIFVSDLSFEVGISGYQSDYYGFCYCRCLSNWEICLDKNDTLNIKRFSKGDTLQPTYNWVKMKKKDYVLATYSYYNDFPNSSTTKGLWNDTQNGFMGIRLIENTDTIYGWIRINITNKYKLEIIDYAIEQNN